MKRMGFHGRATDRLSQEYAAGAVRHRKRRRQTLTTLEAAANSIINSNTKAAGVASSRFESPMFRLCAGLLFATNVEIAPRHADTDRVTGDDVDQRRNHDQEEDRCRRLRNDNEFDQADDKNEHR